jgi:2-polyprenyl-3-methyl-5-hydroxy-6-metoxy-1,4-benzoquinol methylase
MDEYDKKESAYFAWDRQDIVPYLPPTADRICEIGCGTGTTLASLKRRYKASFVAGFDISERSIATACSRLDKAEVIDIDCNPLPSYVENIDLFLCLDVLEHLKDPWRVVEALHARLRPGGSIIASIPNIRYYKVSMGLLFGGKWDLADAGLLDRTHLRFFVKKTAIELMTSSGSQLEAFGANYRRRLDKAAVKLTAGLLADICAVQYVIRVTKPK